MLDVAGTIERVQSMVIEVEGVGELVWRDGRVTGALLLTNLLELWADGQWVLPVDPLSQREVFDVANPLAVTGALGSWFSGAARVIQRDLVGFAPIGGPGVVV